MEKAKTITIVYGVCAFLAMFIIVYALGGNKTSVGGAIFLWSWVNYKMLTSDKPLPVAYDNVYRKELLFGMDDVNTTSIQRTSFCRYCGAKLDEQSTHCSICDRER
jgi:hypothetical protein